MRLIVVMMLLLSSPALASMQWEQSRKTLCINAKWNGNNEFWDSVIEHADAVGIDVVCKGRLVWAECQLNPKNTVGQALASIYYKIEFNKILPNFRCGA